MNNSVPFNIYERLYNIGGTFLVYSTKNIILILSKAVIYCSIIFLCKNSVLKSKTSFKTFLGYIKSNLLKTVLVIIAFVAAEWIFQIILCFSVNPSLFHSNPYDFYCEPYELHLVLKPVRALYTLISPHYTIILIKTLWNFPLILMFYVLNIILEKGSSFKINLRNLVFSRKTFFSVCFIGVLLVIFESILNNYANWSPFTDGNFRYVRIYRLLDEIFRQIIAAFVCTFTGVAFFDKLTEYGLENEATLDD